MIEVIPLGMFVNSNVLYLPNWFITSYKMTGYDTAL